MFFLRDSNEVEVVLYTSIGGVPLSVEGRDIGIEDPLAVSSSVLYNYPISSSNGLFSQVKYINTQYAFLF